jgi:3,4-dihydroxy 2-butanone 4-phosphate synthase/GTP cyclohydrolase II
VRAGHTEAAVDIARLAGLYPAGVLCEIMKDDGTMARLPDLIDFASAHRLKIATIADLIAHRLRNERIVERVAETEIDSRHGGRFRLVVYANSVDYAEHVALVKGDVSGGDPVLVRMHAFSIMDDLLGDTAGPHHGELQRAMEMIGQAGRGVVVVIREPRPTSLSARIRARAGGTMRPPPELRDYGVGAQILLDLGVRDMILLSNTRRTIVGLEGYGLSVAEQRPLPVLEV